MKMTQSSVFVRDCRGREARVADMIRAAFKARFGSGDEEAAIVRELRRSGCVVAELMALEDGEPVAHAMFSRVAAEPSSLRAAALGPVCVRVDRQRRGIGDSLIRAGLADCREAGIEAVIVLGDDYYRRFGFRAELLGGIACAFAGEHLQGLELRQGAFAGVRSLAYAPAFQDSAG
ncbi:MAG TPA: N-acetyltransferase [Rhizomicrobium sp.]|nr:N-acetyltransferase [Rhizomicrobium sp.]